MEQKKKNFKVPHSLVIIAFIVLFAAVMTWIIPAGAYERVENALGMKVIDPNSFTYVEKNPIMPWEIPNFFMEGYMDTASLIFLILFSGAAFEVITSSGALQSLVGSIVRKFDSKEAIFIPLLTLVFGLICTTQGVNMFIGFAPVMVMIATAMGFDAITGVAIILLGGAVGFSTGTLNISTTIVAQKIAEVPLYSGIYYRAFSFVVFYIVTNIYLVRYAKKIKKNPELSPMYDISSKEIQDFKEEENKHIPMDLRKWLVIATLFITLGVIVYGGIKLKWKLEQNAVAFIWMAIIAGICAGYGPSRIAKCFVDGAKKMIGAALIIGMAFRFPGC